MAELESLTLLSQRRGRLLPLTRWEKVLKARGSLWKKRAWVNSAQSSEDIQENKVETCQNRWAGVTTCPKTGESAQNQHHFLKI